MAVPFAFLGLGPLHLFWLLEGVFIIAVGLTAIFQQAGCARGMASFLYPLEEGKGCSAEASLLWREFFTVLVILGFSCIVLALMRVSRTIMLVASLPWVSLWLSFIVLAVENRETNGAPGAFPVGIVSLAVFAFAATCHQDFQLGTDGAVLN